MADEYYIFTGGVVPPDVTRVRIDESVSVIPARAFRYKNIEEVDFHSGVKKVGAYAFYNCPSLRRAIMPGVEVVERGAFQNCVALTYVECGELKIIGHRAFYNCISLRSVDLPSAKIVEAEAFGCCFTLTRISFGVKLESTSGRAFAGCTSLERIILPLKDGMMISDNAFQGCGNLKHVDLVEGAILDETIAVLLMEEWKKNMNEEIASINQFFSTAYGCTNNTGGKAVAIRVWIRSVLHKIIQYKAQHQSYLDEAATTLELALPNDIVSRNVLPFLELPSCTFQGED